MSCAWTRWFISYEWWDSAPVSCRPTGFYHYAGSCESGWHHVSGRAREWDGNSAFHIFMSSQMQWIRGERVSLSLAFFLFVFVWLKCDAKWGECGAGAAEEVRRRQLLFSAKTLKIIVLTKSSWLEVEGVFMSINGLSWKVHPSVERTLSPQATFF